MDPNFSLSIVTKPRRIVQQYHILESKFWEPITSTTQDGMADGDNAAVWMDLHAKSKATQNQNYLHVICLPASSHLIISIQFLCNFECM